MTYASAHVEQRRNRAGVYRKAVLRLVDQLIEVAPHMATADQKAVVFDRFVDAVNEKMREMQR